MTQPAAARLESRRGAPVVFEGVSIDGRVDGLVFAVTLQQRFRNPGARHIEVVYTFPLPDGAVLLGVEVRLGDIELRGAVSEKRQAALDYEDSLADGDAAIMLEQNRDHSYSLNLGNLAPGEACVTTVRYAQTLQFEQRGLRLCIPTVIAPRYGDAVRDGGLAPHQVQEHDLSAHYPFTLSLTLAGALAQSRVGSPSHAVMTERAGEALTVSLARSGALDRDFILVLDHLQHDSVAVAAPDTVTPGQGAVLASFCPRIGAAPRALAAQLLVDCSGSMAGDSIDAARRALHAIVANMQDGERFSLSRFGSLVEHRGRGLWRACGRTRLAAGRWVEALEADMGGTEMEAALTSTFATAGGPGDVLLITDGQIEAIEGAIAAARSSGHRIFVVGIGSSPAGSHLRRLAQASGGACDFCAPGEQVEPAVLRMFARLRSPRLHDLRVAWPSAQPAWSSPLPESVFDGDTVNLFALGCTGMEGEVVLLGRDGSGAETEVGRASIGAGTAHDDTLARLAAHARAASPGENALRLALDYQLVTAQTNFLLVHERAVGGKAPDMPALHAIRPMVPAGWAGTGTVTHAVSALRFPAVFRRGDAATAGVAGGAFRQPQAQYDIPAFLRKAADPAPQDSAGGGHGGLTPSGLRTLLKKARPADYTYAALRGWGLGVAVLDWLELVIGDDAAETQVVAAFLFVIAGGAGAGIDRALADRIAAQLAGMGNEHWPACVFALDEVAAPA